MDTEKIKLNEIEVLSHEPLLDDGTTSVDRERMMIDGVTSWVTTVRTKSSYIGLHFDEKLVRGGIQTEPGSLLIDQNSTAQALGRKAGYKPEAYLANASSDETTVGVMPNHLGWQKGAFAIQDGKMILVANDEGKLSGQFFALTQNNKGEWALQDITLVNGRVAEDDNEKIKDVSVGFSGPAIIHDGSVVPLEEIIDDPRLVADMRNVVQYNNGEAVGAEFFQHIRGFSPSHQARARMVREQPSSVVIRAPIPDSEQEKERYEQVRGTITTGNLSHLEMDQKGSDYRLLVRGKLQEQRLPLIGIGIIENNQGQELLVVAADGRQTGRSGEKIPGITIAELGRLMKKKGARDAILGPGGGDVAIVAKTNEGTQVFNSPSTVDKESGKHVTREVPCLMTIPVKR